MSSRPPEVIVRAVKSTGNFNACDGAIVAMIVGLPLVGAAVAGRELRQYFVLPPPLEVPDDYLRFSWRAVAAVMACVAATVLPWWRRRTAGANRNRNGERTQRRVVRRWPAWGSLALGWTVVWWALAWTRWEWFAPWQRYTFFPLWLGFIVSVNAATVWRTGGCLMLRAPGRWAGLFAASAVCWWGFEWLNRFARNWHYLAVEEFGPVAYAVHATLCFATVLPAVAAVAEWIDTHERWRIAARTGPSWRWLDSGAVRVGLGLAGVVALIGTGLMPRWFYPALWVAPLALGLGWRRTGAGAELARGDWTRALPWMLGALVCGLFWELWNWHSLAKWVYTVPGVERWHVFEMPLLGYAGYLPFGLECLLVAERVIGNRWRAGHGRDARATGAG